jgi:hypothetical protein
MIEVALGPIISQDDRALLVRVPEGLIILVRDGEHVLIRAANARLVVAS